MIKLIAKFLKVLNSETDPGQISLALCFSMISGFTPVFSLHNIFVLLLVLIIRVNLSAFIVGFAFFKTMAYMLDPLFNQIGISLLTLEQLENLWTSMYNSIFWRLERFNNSILMGSLIFSILAFPVVYFLANWLIIRYREKVLGWVEKTSIMHMFKASKLFNAYQSATGWGGK